YEGDLYIGYNLFLDIYNECMKIHDDAGTANSTATAVITRNVMTRVCAQLRTAPTPHPDFVQITHRKSGNWVGPIEISQNMAWSGDTGAYDWQFVFQTSALDATGYSIENLRVIGNVANMSGSQHFISIYSAGDGCLVLNNTGIE